MNNLLRKFDLSYLYAFLGESTLALTFIFYIAIARVLGPEDYGVFAAAIALAAILSLFIQFGLPMLINREIAARSEEATQRIGLFLIVECLTSTGVLIALLPITLLLGYRGDGAIWVCYLAVFSEIGRAMITTLRSSTKGLGWFRAESIAVTIERLAVVGIATLVLFRTQSTAWVLFTVVVVRILHVIGFLIFLSRRNKILSPINRQAIVNTLKIAYPFALSGVLWILYYQVDVVMLKALSTEAETGFYSASYRILEIFSALPRVVFYVVFTRFAKYQVSAPERLPEQIYKAARLLLFIVIPTVFVAGLIQTNLVLTIYDEAYLQSVKSLSILLPSLSVKMFGSISQNFLQATGRERKVPKVLMGAASANVIINIILIPQFASVGAAIATLLSECIMASLAFVMLSQVGYRRASISLVAITMASLLLTAIPSFLIYGLNPMLGGIIVLPCLGFLIYRMRYKFFQTATAS